MKHYGDITKINGYDLPIVDVITGGSPCQDISVANGNRAGLAGGRSGLFFDLVRIIKEIRQHDRELHGRGANVIIRPRFLVFENVPGLYTSNGGADFQTVLSELVRIAEPSAPDVLMPKRWTKSGCLYDELGRWSIAWRLHDSEFWGTPQRRKRISIIADFAGLSAPEVLFERKGLRRDYTESCEEGQGAATTAKGDTREAGVTLIEMTSTKNTIIEDGICPTLTARMGTGGNQVNAVLIPEGPAAFQNTGHGWWNETSTATAVRTPAGGGGMEANIVLNGKGVLRRLTPEEVERLQGYPTGWTDIGEWTDTNGKRHRPADSPRYLALGNSICLPFWQYLARRICAQYERDITMGSLFDGIGGFPLVFERCGAKAVWASEISEFAIAVTRRHFPEEGGT